jgi:hypothetical protein
VCTVHTDTALFSLFSLSPAAILVLSTTPVIHLPTVLRLPDPVNRVGRGRVNRAEALNVPKGQVVSIQLVNGLLKFSSWRVKYMSRALNVEFSDERRKGLRVVVMLQRNRKHT